MNTFAFIHWRFFLRVTSEEKASKLLCQVSQIIGRDVTMTSYEQYWKDPTLFVTTAVSPLDIVDPAQAVFTTLLIAAPLAGWSISGPQEYAGEQWSFAGYATEQPYVRVPGIVLAEFEVRNFELKQSERDQ
jgi:hypothetical protein